MGTCVLAPCTAPPGRPPGWARSAPEYLPRALRPEAW